MKKDSHGFTIIEVLIVLAIAALIMLIVFLAVPALQRNSRNNGRNGDAARIASAVASCLADHNNQWTSCIADSTSSVDKGRMAELSSTITFGFVGFSALGDATYNTNGAYVMYNAQCNSAGSTIAANSGGPVTKFAVTYGLETGITRCLAG